MVYLLDDKYLFTGDTLWFGADGGYSFISSLAEDNKLAVQSLAELESKLRARGLHPYFITGHTGWTDNFEFAFAHKDKLCSPFKKRVHDPSAPYDAYDETAVHLIDQIDYDFSEAEKNSRSLMQRFGSLEVAMRQNDLAFEVLDYLKGHPNAAVVNLGCGLDSTGRACDNGNCKIYNLDFSDVITVRNELLPVGEREENIPCDLNNTEWFRKIDASNGAVFFASGVFYYFLTEQVRVLVWAMADAFPGGVLVFDAANRTAVKMIAKTWLKSAKIQDVGAYFAVSDAKREIGAWDSQMCIRDSSFIKGSKCLQRW